MKYTILLTSNNLPVIITEKKEVNQSTVSETIETANKLTGSTVLAVIVIVLLVLVVILLSIFVVYVKNNKPTKDKSKKVEGMVTGVGSTSHGQNPDPESYTEIVLTNMLNPNIEYRKKIEDRIVVGRTAPADIIIVGDMAVSAEQCEFTMKGSQIYLNDSNSTNGTYYNEQEVDHQIPILSGGILEIGYGQYHLSIEKR